MGILLVFIAVSKVFQWCFEDISWVFKGASLMHKGCFKHTLKGISSGHICCIYMVPKVAEINRKSVV